MATTASATKQAEKIAVRSVVPCLTFRDQAEAAVNLYVSIFKNSKINSIVRSETDGPIPKGKVLHATFELNGREYTAFDGGPHFTFTEGFSLVATCDTQEELDQVWRRLSEGGKEGPCGWLTDPFGVSWQVLPTSLGRMMSDSESGNPGKVMEALLKMGKLDIATLEKAYKG
jgi:predicted 3-demethylubiquinone-9 3-methyltransferase (glyoxalase superfamily)